MGTTRESATAAFKTTFATTSIIASTPCATVADDYSNHPRGSTTTGSNTRLIVAGCIAGTTVFGTLALMVPFVFTKSSLPYMATPGHKVRQALQFVMEQQNHHHHHHHKIPTCATLPSSSRNKLTFVDLGSGDGEAVWQATRLGYQHAIGMELNFTLVLLSRLRRRLFWTQEQQARSTFLHQDMLVDDDKDDKKWTNYIHQQEQQSPDYYLSSCHACMIFGVQPLMETLSRKLARTCQPGTHVLSYRFPLPTATVEKPDLLVADQVYNQQEMRIYKVISSSSSSIAPAATTVYSL
jgi:hypothetical protein